MSKTKSKQGKKKNEKVTKARKFYHGDEKDAATTKHIRQLSNDRRGDELKDREQGAEGTAEENNVHFGGPFDG